MCDVAELPEELLVEIFECLDYDDRGRVKQVCRSWNRICGDIYTVYRPYAKNLITVRPDTRTGRVTHITLSDSECTDEVLATFAQLVPNLREFRMNNCLSITCMGLKALIAVTPKLRTLAITDCSQIEGAGLDAAIGYRAINLSLTGAARKVEQVRPGEYVLWRREDRDGEKFVVYGVTVGAASTGLGKFGHRRTFLRANCLHTGRLHEEVTLGHSPMETFLITRREYECLGHMDEDTFFFVDARGNCFERELKELFAMRGQLENLKRDVAQFEKHQAQGQIFKVGMQRLGEDPTWYIDRWELTAAPTP